MSNPAGTRFARSLLPLLQEYYGPQADRAALHGNRDIGDFYLPGELRLILEAKAVKKTDLSGWVAEAKEEARNAWGQWKTSVPPVGVVVHKKRGVTDPRQQYVTLALGDFLRLINGR